MCSPARGSECWKEGSSFGFCPWSARLKIFKVNYVLIKELAEEVTSLSDLCLSVFGRVQAGHLQHHLPAWHPPPQGTVPLQVQGPTAPGVGRGGEDALVRGGEKRAEKILDGSMGLSLSFVGDLGL